MMVELVKKKISRDDVAQYFKDNCRAIKQEKTTDIPKKKTGLKSRIDQEK